MAKTAQLKNVDGFLPWAKVIVRFKCLQMIDDLRRERCIVSDRTLPLLADEAESIDSKTHAARQDAFRQC